MNKILVIMLGMAVAFCPQQPRGDSRYYQLDTGSTCSECFDCQSKVCRGGFCDPPTCIDEEQNQHETSVDCGGECSPCPLEFPCFYGQDCVTSVCCLDANQTACFSENCFDGVANSGETDVDCGGSCLAACADGMQCRDSRDCDSFRCRNLDLEFGDSYCLAPTPSTTKPQLVSYMSSYVTIAGETKASFRREAFVAAVGLLVDVPTDQVTVDVLQEIQAPRSFVDPRSFLSSVVVPDPSTVGFPDGVAGRASECRRLLGSERRLQTDGAPRDESYIFVTTSTTVAKLKVRFSVYCEPYEVELLQVRLLRLFDAYVELEADGKATRGIDGREDDDDLSVEPLVQARNLRRNRSTRNITLSSTSPRDLDPARWEGARLVAAARWTHRDARRTQQEVQEEQGVELPGVAGIEWIPGPGKYNLLALLVYAGLESAVSVDKSGANSLDAEYDSANRGQRASQFFLPHSVVVERQPNRSDEIPLYNEARFPVQPLAYVQDRHGRPIIRFEETAFITASLNSTVFPEPDDILERENATLLFGITTQRLEYYADGRAEFSDLLITQPEDELTLLFDFSIDEGALNDITVIQGRSLPFRVTYLAPPVEIPHPRVPFPAGAIIALFSGGMAVLIASLWCFRRELGRLFGLKSITEPFKKKQVVTSDLVYADVERAVVNVDEVARPEYVFAVDGDVSSEAGYDTFDGQSEMSGGALDQLQAPGHKGRSSSPRGSIQSSLTDGTTAHGSKNVEYSTQSHPGDTAQPDDELQLEATARISEAEASGPKDTVQGHDDTESDSHRIETAGRQGSIDWNRPEQKNAPTVPVTRVRSARTSKRVAWAEEYPSGLQESASENDDATSSVMSFRDMEDRDREEGKQGSNQPNPRVPDGSYAPENSMVSLDSKGSRYLGSASMQPRPHGAAGRYQVDSTREAKRHARGRKGGRAMHAGVSRSNLLPPMIAPVAKMSQVVPVLGNAYAGEAFDVIDSTVGIADAEPREMKDQLEIVAKSPAARPPEMEAVEGVRTASERWRDARHACQDCLESFFRLIWLNGAAEAVKVNPDWDQSPEVQTRNREARAAAAREALQEKLQREEEERESAALEYDSDSDEDSSSEGGEAGGEGMRQKSEEAVVVLENVDDVLADIG